MKYRGFSTEPLYSPHVRVALRRKNKTGRRPRDIPFCMNFPYIHRTTCQPTGYCRPKAGEVIPLFFPLVRYDNRHFQHGDTTQ